MFSNVRISHCLVLLLSWVIFSAESARKDDVPSDPEVDKYEEMVLIEGKEFVMGTDAEDGKEGEGPTRLEKVKNFKINRYPVTIASFRKFVKAKKYKTDAETFGWSFVLEMFVPKEVSDKAKDRIQGAPWWVPVDRAYWRMPEGKGSSVVHRLNNPAVHISHRDARAYCQWHGWRLPTEIEWEYAARGGLAKRKYPWGNKFDVNRMNIWQGKFPDKNSEEDGYKGVSPVDAFPSQNEFDLFDMVGNVWEWTSSRFDGSSEDTEETEGTKYTLRGGSYIDSKDGSFNHQVRVTTRTGNTPDAGSDNLGFRCAMSVASNTQKPPKGKKKGTDKKQRTEEPDVIIQEGQKVKEVKPHPADLNGRKKKSKNEL
ncbi:inactive C-alpha-formylglycine-generating enzyme 2-like [Asterias amurensis]|uniref:inactive C-alpha-formylglycine-generating enzyme 2-like n=1 Tax=Asterias amurensis TaxID=7602 RepID=UPI003AB53D1F